MTKRNDKISRKLKKEIMSNYKGNDFQEIQIDDSGKFKAYVKVDGHTQILMYPKNTKDVYVKIEDLYFKMNAK